MPLTVKDRWAKAEEETVEALRAVLVRDLERARLALQRAHYRVLGLRDGDDDGRSS